MLTDERIDEIHPMVKDFPHWKRTFARAIEAEVLAGTVCCTRSHPHENMSAECEAKTAAARRIFMEAQEPSPCPKCADAAPIVRDLMLNVIVLKEERDALQAKVAEQRNRDFETIERLKVCVVDEREVRQRVERAAVAGREKQSALIEKLEKGLVAVSQLIAESTGVDGLHLNGDIAPWSSLRTGGGFEPWLVELDEALDAIAAQKGGAK